jgi:hypothetical protein
VSRSTEELIAALAQGARPVKRLRPPARRAAAWLVLLVGLGLAWIALKADLGDFVRRTGSLQAGLAWAASLATGLVATVAAAHLALPDRSRRWALAPLPFLALWVGLSGLRCIGLAPHPDGDSAACFRFVLVAGLPATAFLVWRLRRAHPMDGALVAAVGALGAAGLSATVLQFFHPFAITWLDLGVHLGAAAILVAAGVLASRLLDRRPA